MMYCLPFFILGLPGNKGQILWGGLDTGDGKFSHNEVLFLGLKPSLLFMSERNVSSWFAYTLCQSIEGN